MKYDIFFSICQTEVAGHTPDERTMFRNFFDQVKLADDLGFGTAWIAETHLSCEVQKGNSDPVIPYFKGEIGLNTDILQLAHKVFAATTRINVGSAVMNILCNGGPLAHAEAIKTFLTLHGLDDNEQRKLEVGFAAGRFPFSNIPYGIKPRNKVEDKAWPVVKGLIFREATEIFMRALQDNIFSSADVTHYALSSDLFRKQSDWDDIVTTFREENNLPAKDKVKSIPIAPFWEFENVGVIPFHARKDLLKLTIGSHDPITQKFANTFLPCGVFNLSITPSDKINETHQYMATNFNADGGPWQRSHMPRTALIFINGDEDKSPQKQSETAKIAAKAALENYWQAMEGTLDSAKIEKAVNNSIAGNPSEVAALLKEKYHPEDRLMLWFDFNNHENEAIKSSMRSFIQNVVPSLP